MDDSNPSAPTAAVQQQPEDQAPTNSSKKTAFVHKLYSMLYDPNIAHLIWWSRPNDPNIFALHPGSEFSHVLKLYFKHGNVSSFVRQLHMYGFHKVFDADEPVFCNQNHRDSQADPVHNSNVDKKDDVVWEFKHSSGYFQQGDDSRLSLIKRRSSNRTSSDDSYETHYQAIYANTFQPVYTHQLQQPLYVPHPYSHMQAVPNYHHHQQPHHVPVQSPSPYQVPPAPAAPVGGMSSQHSPYIFTGGQLPSALPQVAYPATRISPPLDHQAYQNIQGSTDSLQQLQAVTNLKSQHLANEIGSTINDMAKIGDTLPKILPILRKVPSPQASQYLEETNKVQQNFHKRANDISNEQQVYATSLEDPQRQSSEVHFWLHSAATRQPSVFVDPLNPTNAPAVGAPVTPTSSSSFSTRPFKLAHHQSNSSLSSFSRAKSVTSFPNLNTRSTSLQNRPLPRSIPTDYDEFRDSTSSIPNINRLTSQLRPSIFEMCNFPRSTTPTSAGSIDVNFPAYNSQKSMSSSSIYSGFSADSSISSMSSRNSQSAGTGPQQSYYYGAPPSSDSPETSRQNDSLATNSRILYLNRPQTPPNQPAFHSSSFSSPGFATDKTLYRPSLATISDSSCSKSVSGSSESDDGNTAGAVTDSSKVKVSSLLSDSEEQHKIKRVKL